MSDLLMSPEKAALWLRDRGWRIAPRTVRRELEGGRMTGRKVGRLWMVSEAQVRAWAGLPATDPAPAGEPANVRPFVVARKASA